MSASLNKYTLRWYQSESINSIYDYFAEHDGNPIIALPTGTGKSLVIAGFIKSVLQNWPKQRMLVLTHVKELVEQDYEKFVDLYPTADAGVNAAKMRRRDTDNSVIFGAIGSVVNSYDSIGHIDLIIIDECHRVAPSQNTQYAKFISAMKEINPKLKVIGLSATIYRQGQGLLTENGLFTDVCYDATTVEHFKRFIEEGYMVPLRPKRTDVQIDTSTVKIVKGEYVQKQLNEVVSQSLITGLEEFVAHAHDRVCWLLFAAGNENSNKIANILTEWGYPTVSITDKTSEKERTEAVAAHRNGELLSLVNNNILTTGYDNPRLDTIGMFRPSRSTSLWVQMLGRGTRPSPDTGKTYCLVLDFAKNTERLGPIDDPVIPKSRNSKKGDAPAKVCEACGMYNHTTVRECVYCGEPFPVKEQLQKVASDKSLMRAVQNVEPPLIETFDVAGVVYRKHQPKDGRPPSLRVDYRTPCHKTFTEYYAFEHEKAKYPCKQFWQERCTLNLGVPQTTDEALAQSDNLVAPEKIRVWLNADPFPKVISHEL